MAQKKAETSAAAARGRLAAQPGEAAAHGRGSLQRGPWGGHQPTRPFVGRGEATLGYLQWGEGKRGARVPGARWPQEKWRSAGAEMLSEVFKRKKENPVLALGKYSCFGTEGDWERRAVRSPLLPQEGAAGVSGDAGEKAMAADPPSSCQNSTFPRSRAGKRRPAAVPRDRRSLRVQQVQGRPRRRPLRDRPRGRPRRQPFSFPRSAALGLAGRLVGGSGRESCQEIGRLKAQKHYGL